MAELFDDVIGDAIALAVRRAVDDVGRAPFGELGDRGAAEPGDATSDTGEVGDEDAIDRLPPGPEVDDPYEILGLPRSASWERIAAAHRRLARKWHPDGADEHEQALREDLIRRLNAAYAELRVRRGR
jgi:DnaJ-class molecular chaperone